MCSRCYRLDGIDWLCQLSFGHGGLWLPECFGPDHASSLSSWFQHGSVGLNQARSGLRLYDDATHLPVPSCLYRIFCLGHLSLDWFFWWGVFWRNPHSTSLQVLFLLLFLFFSSSFRRSTDNNLQVLFLLFTFGFFCLAASSRFDMMLVRSHVCPSSECNAQKNVKKRIHTQ